MASTLRVLFFLLCTFCVIVLLYYPSVMYRYGVDRTAAHRTTAASVRNKRTKLQARKNTTHLLQEDPTRHKKELTIYSDDMPSRSNNIDVRGKWQQGQIEKFCKKYNLELTKYTIPDRGTRDAINLFRHLIYVEDKKLLFCFLPKVGCNHAKQLIFILAGMLPMETVQVRGAVTNEMIERAIKRSSFANKLLTADDKLDKLTTYWKFTIVRNPLERLLSAFRNKLSAPLIRSIMYTDYFENVKRQILQKYDLENMRRWKISKSKSNITVDFQMYIRWIVDSENELLDDHFQPMIHLAQPCRVQYDFFGNLDQISTDMGLVMDKFNVSRYFFKDWSRPGPSTSSLMMDYYSTVSAELKQALFQDFYVELDFYYHLFPEEKDSHVKLLGVKEVIS